jgi:uncharacterized protein DUF6766
MRRFLSDNSLALFFIALFFACALGDALTGWHVFNAEQREHHETTVSLWRYLVSSDFAEAMSENWESEFLQFTTFFVASIWLFQRGSAESKPKPELGLESKEEQKVEDEATTRSPLWARAGGFRTRLYAWSLTIVMSSFFFASWLAQSLSGWTVYNNQQEAHREPTISWLGYVGSAHFWEPTFQNWQSEFMAVATIALFSIYFRQRGSHDSKAVGDPHEKTGTE